MSKIVSTTPPTGSSRSARANKRPAERIMPRFFMGGNSELHRLRVLPAALVIIIIIPLLYGIFFLWAYIDPTHNLGQMKIAVVNQDQVAQAPDGSTLHVGPQVVSKLQGSDNFDWVLTTDTQAEEGLESGTYFATLTIPADFSASIATIGSEAPRQAPLDIQYDDANGKTASQIISAAMSRVHSSVAESIGEGASRKVFVGLNSVHTGLKEASDGSQRLADGAVQLRDGAAELQGGTSQLKSGSAELASKTGEAANGAGRLDEGATKLESGARELADGNAQLAQGLAQMQSKVAALRTIPGVMNIPEVRQLVEGVDQAQQGSAKLADGSQQLAAGASELQDGTSKLNNGLQQLSTGAQRLAEGNAKAADGAERLAAGSKELSDGAGLLNQRLGDAARMAPAYNTQVAATNSKVLSNPAQLNESWRNYAPNYGEGMAPYLMGLALFVGGIFIWQVLRPISPRNLAAPISAVRATMQSMRPAIVLGIIQVGLLATTLYWGLKIQPENMTAWVGLMLVASFGFIVFQQAMIVLLGGSAGRLISIAFLVVQLASAGGTYPVQTAPRLFQVIHPYMPMSYVVSGLRQASVGNMGSVFWTSLAVLSGFGLVCWVLTVLGVSRRRVYTLDTLYPPLGTDD